MDTSARVEADGRITLPPEVREALGLAEGDSVLFRVNGKGAAIARTPDLLELAGSFKIPEDKRGVPWEVIREETHRAIAAERR